MKSLSMSLRCVFFLMFLFAGMRRMNAFGNLAHQGISQSDLSP